LIIGAEADGVGPSVLLTCAGSQRQYLFGAAEGFSRLALECRARPTAKLRAVFLSSFRPRASGGLGGLLLRLCADGHKSVCLAGPPGVGTHVEALRDFVRFRHPEVTALRLVPPGLTRRDGDVFAPDDTRACDAAAESYRDDAVMVFPLFAPSGAGPDAFETCRVCAAVDEASSDDSSSDEASSDEASSDEASEPPLKRVRSDEASRSSSESDERSRRDVIGYACAIRENDARVSATFLVLDCADDADARAAAGNATVRCCMRGQADRKNEKHPRACAAFHLTRRDVASRPAYDAVRRRADDVFDPSVLIDPGLEKKHARVDERSILHVDCSVAGEVGFRAGARTLARLHAVDPDTFPLSPSLRAPYRAPEPDLRSDPKKTTRGSRAAPPTGRRGDVRSAVGSLCATVTLFRARTGGVGGYASMDQRSNRAPELDVDAIVSKALLSRLRVAEDENENAEDHENERRRTSSAAAAAAASSAPSLLFLGTGSAEPSKYRGSSGVLVKLPSVIDDDERPGTGIPGIPGIPGTGTRRARRDGGYALLDCGEGVAGAARRFLGDDEGGRVLDELRFVFVTHHHPDHMAGLLGVLAARSRNAPPLPIFGPSATARWLRRAVETGAVGGVDRKTETSETSEPWARSRRAIDDGLEKLVSFTHTTSLYARDAGSFGGPFWIPPKPDPTTRFPPPRGSIGIGTGIGFNIPPPPPPPPPPPAAAPAVRVPGLVAPGGGPGGALPRGVGGDPRGIGRVQPVLQRGLPPLAAARRRGARRAGARARGDVRGRPAAARRAQTPLHRLRGTARLRRRARGRDHPDALLAAVPQGGGSGQRSARRQSGGKRRETPHVRWIRRMRV
jgi:ribonuclease Z